MSVNDLIENLKSEYGGAAALSLTFKDNKIPENISAYNIPVLSRSEYLFIGQFDYVKKVELHSFIHRMKAAEAKITSSGEQLPMNSREVYLIGYNMEYKNPLIESADTVILSGRIPAADNECCIPNYFLSLNRGLLSGVGDEITVADMKNGTEKVYTVTGVFDDSKIEQRFSYDAINSLCIFTTIEGAEFFYIEKTIQTRGTYEESGITIKNGYDAAVYLDSYKDFDQFKTMCRNKIVTVNGSDYRYNVHYYNEDFSDMIRPLNKTKSNSFITLILMNIFCMIVIVTVTCYNLQVRKYEIGVLRSIGMSKSGIMVNFMLEFTIVILFSLFTAFLLSLPFYGSVNDISGTAAVSLPDIRISFMCITAIAITLNLLSAMLTSMYMINFSPMKILTGRNN